MKLQLPPEPLTRGLLSPDPCPLSSTEFDEPPPPPNKIPGYATDSQGQTSKARKPSNKAVISEIKEALDRKLISLI